MAKGWQQNLNGDMESWSVEAFLSLALPSLMNLSTSSRVNCWQELSMPKDFCDTRLKHASVIPKAGHSVLRIVQLTWGKSGGAQ